MQLMMAQELHQGQVYLKCLLPFEDAFVNSANHQESQAVEEYT